MKIMTNIDANNNEISNAVINGITMKPLTAAPENAKEGEFYYNSVEKQAYQYNGVEWVPMGGNTGSTYAIEPTAEQIEAQTDDVVIIEGIVTKPNNGDIAIVKREIATDSEGNKKYAYTTYVYDADDKENPVWSAADGSYNANNVYFDSDLTITANVGVHKVNSTTGSKTIEITGKNVKQVMDTLFASEANPKATNPSVSALTLKNGTATLNATAEVGTTITPTYSATFSAGSYTYGPATGISAKSWSVTDSKGENATTKDGSFDAFKIEDEEVYKVTATATYDAGTGIPVTNLGNKYESVKIPGGTTVAKDSNSVTGYREGCFYGNLTTIPETFTSATIRGLVKTGAKYSAKEISHKVIVGTKAIVIACPADETGMTEVLNTTVNAKMGSNFVKQTVSVGGADATADNIGDYAVNYNVWVYTPAEAYGSEADLTITLG